MPENIGHVIQISGPAVDVQFEPGKMPPIYEALRVVSEGFTVPSQINVILEVQQHLGEGRVRCVAMEATDGMVRGMKAIDLKGPDFCAGGPRHAGPGDECHWAAGGSTGAHRAYSDYAHSPARAALMSNPPPRRCSKPASRSLISSSPS